MGSPAGFAWVRRKNGDVAISHHGRHATTLRGSKAQSFVEELDGIAVTSDAAQQRMARLTGNYKRGNERRSGPKP